jgi:hypothetical protein
MAPTARAANALSCVSNDDLIAPYRARERRRHEELCAMLPTNHSRTTRRSFFLFICSSQRNIALPRTLQRVGQ